MDKIQLLKVNKMYGNIQVLFDINWDINISNKGIIALMGENGAGKSTLLKIISGILHQNSGQILWDDNMKNYGKWARENIAYIQAGERGLRLKNTVYDNIMYYGLLKGKTIKSVKEKIDQYAIQINAEKLLKKRCEELSMGERKKAQILCGLCCSGKLLILDEPSTGLDIRSIIELKDILGKLYIERNICTIIASHDIYFLKDIGKEYVFLHEGKIDNIVDRSLSETEIEEYCR